MKKLHLLLIAFILFIQSCTVMKDVQTIQRDATYSVRLDKVELPSNSKERFSKTILKEQSDKDVTKYSFEDENIHILWSVNKDNFWFTIRNKTDHAIKINWDEVVYVNAEKYISKMTHSGVKYIQRNEAQVPTTIPSEAKLEDILVPVSNVKLVSNEWVTEPIFPNKFPSEESLICAKQLEGKTISILLPIKIEDVQNDYIFHFKIDNVETSTYTIVNQEHDKGAEATKTAGTILFSTMIAGAIIGLLIFSPNKNY